MFVPQKNQNVVKMVAHDTSTRVDGFKPQCHTTNPIRAPPQGILDNGPSSHGVSFATMDQDDICNKDYFSGVLTIGEPLGVSQCHVSRMRL